MRNWIIATQTTNIIGPNANAAQEIRSVQGKPGYVHPTDHSIVVTESLERSMRFQKLVSQWRTERGATSSIEEMCTRPAYLSIMAMGPDALPLLLGQLRAEGDDPDHWFVALHYITKGVDPVPAQDKGDMAKMSDAWLDWAEREGDAR